MLKSSSVRIQEKRRRQWGETEGVKVVRMWLNEIDFNANDQSAASSSYICFGKLRIARVTSYRFEQFIN